MLLGSMTFAQTPLVGGTIAPVKEDGLYRIRVPHKIRTHATNDFRDLRIWDAKGNPVPYFMQPAAAYTKTSVSDFKEFSIVTNTRIADSSATYIFKNPNKTIANAVLLIANYQGNKTYRLEGSDDQKEWFGLVNSGQLNQLNDPKEISVYKAIHFPLCKYEYLKIVFDDRNSLPINLLRIGEATTETQTTVPIAMEKIAVKNIAYLEKDKKTHIQVSFERPEVIDQIRMRISAPDLFSRDARLYTLKERKVKRKMETYRQELADFYIRSDKELIFDISRTMVKEVILEIDNRDNPKLEISELHFMQEPVYMTAALKADGTYTVTGGDQTLGFPDYDILDTTYRASSGLSIVEIDAVVYEPTSKTIVNTTSFWQQSWFMWCCIGAATVMILYFSLNLLKDLNRNKTEI